MKAGTYCSTPKLSASCSHVIQEGECILSGAYALNYTKGTPVKRFFEEERSIYIQV